MGYEKRQIFLPEMKAVASWEKIIEAHVATCRHLKSQAK